MAEKEKLLIIHFFVPKDFYSIWERFKQLAKKDPALNEVGYLKVNLKARPVPTVMRNLIRDYVKSHEESTTTQ